MTPLERYRELYEYEKDCNRKMLAMIESVPESSRSDARFQQAANIAGHVAACRTNWLDMMDGDGANQENWFDQACDPATLAARFSALETRWTDYLNRLDDTGLVRDFAIPIGGGKHVHWPVEEQVLQLVVHAAYHRGQVAILVDQLGGETVDMDYIYWRRPLSNG